MVSVKEEVAHHYLGQGGLVWFQLMLLILLRLQVDTWILHATIGLIIARLFFHFASNNPCLHIQIPKPFVFVSFFHWFGVAGEW